ncbi:competence protein ComEC [Caldicoprobacter guelmensis]|uniref:DNA internalization-related competence protein ComEC/Rec2 n=1 Tax=Caldicoprobacter guelmensis TaxID=1170224 RepID=UPI0019560B7F|nr:DNA internalization-related competence protein ComEC/Rec2 [Caldicoprobacter guelmensis]MBM7583161.1 competence protein ComEC [Caldicoprobacter guelmensis]
MTVWVKRPAIWLTSAYIVGIVVGTRLGKEFALVVIVVAVLVAAIAWVRKRKNDTGLIPLLVLFGLLGILAVLAKQNILNPLRDFTGKIVEIRGQIVESPRYDEQRNIYVVETFSVVADGDRRDVKTKVQVNVYPEGQQKERPSYSYGDIVEIRGRLEEPPGQRNPKGFDYRTYLQRRGIYNIMSVKSYNIKKTGVGNTPYVQSFIYGLKNRTEVVFDRYVGGDEGALVKTMLLGQKWLLPSEIQQDFQVTGLSHVLAISGLHVGFIAAALSSIAGLLCLTKRQAFIFQVCLLCLYCAMVGAAPSVVRAVVMAVLLLGAKAVGREPDMFNNLFLAAFLILLFRPLDLFDVGFQLSFGAVVGIILFAERFKKWLRFLPGWMGAGVAVTLSAQIGVWPIIAYYFNNFSIVALIANLFLVPLSGIIILIGFALMVGALLVPGIGVFVGPVLKFLCFLLVKGNEIFTAIPWAFIRVVSPSLLFMMCYYLAVWFLSPEKPGWMKQPLLWCGAMAIMLLLVGMLTPLVDNDLEVVFLDVGQGDCIYIRTPDEKHILIDGGGKSEDYTGTFDVGEDIVVPFLLKNGVGDLDLVVMSHAHDDHIGGLIAVLENISVKAFMEYPPGEKSDNYIRLKELVREKGIKNVYAYSGLSYKVGKDVRLDVVYPDAEGKQPEALFERGDNNRSLVVLLRYRDAAVLFTGDIEADVEKYLTMKWNMPIDILKVAHHGSNTSSTHEWLEVLKPKLAVIQVGKNAFGHPHPDVIQRLEDRGIRVLRNDFHGAVIASYKGTKWRVRWMANEW